MAVTGVIRIDPNIKTRVDDLVEKATSTVPNSDSPPTSCAVVKVSDSIRFDVQRFVVRDDRLTRDTVKETDSVFEISLNSKFVTFREKESEGGDEGTGGRIMSSLRIETATVELDCANPHHMTIRSIRDDGTNSMRVTATSNIQRDEIALCIRRLRTMPYHSEDLKRDDVLASESEGSTATSGSVSETKRRGEDGALHSLPKGTSRAPSEIATESKTTMSTNVRKSMVVPHTKDADDERPKKGGELEQERNVTSTKARNEDRTTPRWESRLEHQVRTLQDELGRVRRELKATLEGSLAHMRTIKSQETVVSQLKSQLDQLARRENRVRSELRDATSGRKELDDRFQSETAAADDLRRALADARKFASREVALAKMCGEEYSELVDERTSSTNGRVAVVESTNERLREEWDRCRQEASEESARAVKMRSLLEHSERRHDDLVDSHLVQTEALERELTAAETRFDETIMRSRRERALGETRESSLGEQVEKLERELKAIRDDSTARSAAALSLEALENRANAFDAERLAWANEKAAITTERNALKQKVKSLGRQLRKKAGIEIESIATRRTKQKKIRTETGAVTEALKICRGHELALRAKLDELFPREKKKTDWLGERDKAMRQSFVQKICLIGAVPPRTEGEFHAARVYIDATKSSVYDAEQWLDFLRLKREMKMSEAQYVKDAANVAKMNTVSNGAASVKLEDERPTTTSSRRGGHNDSTSPAAGRRAKNSSMAHDQTRFLSGGHSRRTFKSLESHNTQLKHVAAALTKQVAALDGQIATLENQIRLKDELLRRQWHRPAEKDLGLISNEAEGGSLEDDGGSDIGALFTGMCVRE